MPTTLGSFAFQHATATKNADVVNDLIANGAIVLGKASMTEFCGNKGSNLTVGWSPIGGQTQSAYIEGGVRDDDLIFGHSTPGGSSSGSAVSVSAGFSPISLGSETDGSTIGPAHRAGLFALKMGPTRVSTGGVFRLTSLDSVGVLAKSTRDLSILLDSIMKRESDLEQSHSRQIEWEDLRVGFVDPSLWHLPESICAKNIIVAQEIVSKEQWQSVSCLLMQDQRSDRTRSQ